MTQLLHPPQAGTDLHRWRDVVRVAARHGIAANSPLEDEIARRGLTLELTEVRDLPGGWSYRAVLRRRDGEVVAEGLGPLRGSDGYLARDTRRMAVLRALAAYLA